MLLVLDFQWINPIVDVDAKCENCLLQKHAGLMERCQAAPSLPYALFNNCWCPSSFAATHFFLGAV